MSTGAGKHQFGDPLISPAPGADGSVQVLKRVKLGSAPAGADAIGDERWLQKLIHAHPDLLPIRELEPGFDRAYSVGMEVPVGGLYIDNLLVTAGGDLVVIECKLWRNPEARRSVVAQAIEYAQKLSTWSYGDLDAAVAKAIDVDGKAVGRSLVSFVSGNTTAGSEFDERDFIDAVQLNLKRGRLLLLIVGDGIREDAERLSRYVQVHAGFHFTLGLVEMAIYELPNNQLLVQPRVLARTLNIERAVVKFGQPPSGVEVQVGLDDERPVSVAMTLTGEKFYQALEASSPETFSLLKIFLAEAQDLGVVAEVATKSLMLKWQAPTGDLFTLAGIDLLGRLTSYSVCWQPSKVGHLGLAHAYLSELATLIGGSVRETPAPENRYVVAAGTTLPMARTALEKKADWMVIIQSYLRKLSNAMEAS